MNKEKDLLAGAILILVFVVLPIVGVTFGVLDVMSQRG